MNLTAEYNDMQNIAKSINNSAQEYINDVNALYAIVENLPDVWEGYDTASYTETVKSYEQDIKALGQVVNNYAEFLNQSAVIIAKTQDSIANKGKKL